MSEQRGQQILQFINDYPGSDSKEIAVLLEMHVQTVYYYTKKMRADGLIKYAEGRQTGGHYPTSKVLDADLGEIDKLVAAATAAETTVIEPIESDPVVLNDLPINVKLFPTHVEISHEDFARLLGGGE